MSTKTEKKASCPMFPMFEELDWDGKKDLKQLKAEFKSDFKSNWEKSIDFQKSYIDSSKDLYDKFFEDMTGLRDSFADSLPEGLPMPSWVDSPKALRKEIKEWEKMANEQFKKTADLRSDFFIKSQEKACAQIPVDEKKEEAVEAKVEEKKAEHAKAPAAKKAAPAKTTAAKKATSAKKTASTKAK